MDDFNTQHYCGTTTRVVTIVGRNNKIHNFSQLIYVKFKYMYTYFPIYIYIYIFELLITNTTKGDITTELGR